MGAPRKADWREERRKRAWALKHEGWLQKDIAVALGVSEGAVSQWMKRARERGGEKAVARQPPPGMLPRLSAGQLAQIPGLLAGGAEAYRFRGDVWTANRVADVIWRHFGVRYHPDHISRLLRRLGWSRQQPLKRAAQRDGEALRQWQDARWPALKKRLPRRDPPLSGRMNRRFTCCRMPCERGRHAARHRVCGSNSARIISLRSVA
ncbi:MAG TPA: winged helix-turn-helix domain-containing protein [Ktedonobacterales bacterium]|nr:winged helix-turn-helix domain-containing protein [Ktedonobacterales bacterium]